jgi:hypothetical protein
MEALERASPQEQRRLLNLMGVGVVEKVDDSNKFGVRFEPVEGSERLRWVPCARHSSGADDSLAQIISGRIDPGAEVVVEGLGPGQGCPADGAHERKRAAAAYLLSETANRVVIRSQAGAPGWLVLSDTWYPGWIARVDGKPVPVLRAASFFRAVQVSAGEHEVVFEYRPWSFYVGSLISLATVLGLAGFYLNSWLPYKSILSSILNPAVLTLLVMAVWVALVIGRAGGDPLALARLGTRYSQGDPAGTQGYDGQFVVYIARDPRPAAVAPLLDAPAYRYQRILLPLLARFISLGSVPALPWVLAIVGITRSRNLGCRELLAAWGEPLVRASYGVVGLQPGRCLDLHEPLAYALVACAILAGERGRHRLSWILYGLALFAKEVAVLFIAAQLLADLGQRRWRSILGLGLAALLPYALFQLSLLNVFGQPGIGSERWRHLRDPGAAAYWPFQPVAGGHGWCSVLPSSCPRSGAALQR